MTTPEVVACIFGLLGVTGLVISRELWVWKRQLIQELRASLQREKDQYEALRDVLETERENYRELLGHQQDLIRSQPLTTRPIEGFPRKRLRTVRRVDQRTQEPLAPSATALERLLKDEDLV